MSEKASRCTLFITDQGTCGKPFARLYGPGPRCPDHTPARLAGRPETIPDPSSTMDGIRASYGINPAVPMTPAGETVVDIKAKASGKRRSSPSDYRAAQAAVESGRRPDLKVAPSPAQAAAAVYTPEKFTGQRKRVWDAMADGQWRTLRELADASESPEASVSARMREFRSEEYGSLPLEAEQMPGSTLWRYRLNVPAQATA